MTPAERLRKHQRALEKTQRELDRERVKLENQEKKLIQDIKKSAKNGQMGACKIQAKDLVRTRRYGTPCLPHKTSALNGSEKQSSIRIPKLTSPPPSLPSRYIQKFYSMRTQLQAISLRIQTVRSNEQMMQSMKGATSLLGSMNRQMNLPALQRIAMEFEKENDIMDQRQEMMDDAIDDVTGLEDEEEGEEVVKEVLDEIGVDLGQAVRMLLTLYSFKGSFGVSKMLRVSKWLCGSLLTTCCGIVGRNTFRSAKDRSHGRPSRRGYRWRWRRTRGRRRGTRRSGSSSSNE